MVLNALCMRMLIVFLLGTLFSAANAADSVQTGSADQALKQKTWAIYESQKKQAWTDYEMERRRIWADYGAERARIWKTYKSGRARVWAAYNAERSRIWNSYNANRTKQNYEAAARYTREAYSTAAQQSREAYGKAAAQSQEVYANAAKQSQDAYACYVAKAKRAYAAYLATTDRDQEDNLKQMEAEVASKCRALAPSPRLACNAPAQSGLEVPDGNPTCEQQWAYYLAKLLVVQQFTAVSRLLDTKEKRALSQQDIFEGAANIVGPMMMLFKSSDIATKVINTYFDLPQLLFHLIPSSDAKKITVIWADWALNSLQAIAVYYATGVVPTSMLILPGIKLVILINTSWNIGGITIDRWRYLVAQDYLIDYFKYGGDLRSIARKYGLPPASTRHKIIDTIARNTVTPSWWMRFPLADTESTVSYYESFIKKFVELCVQGKCQAGTGS